MHTTSDGEDGTATDFETARMRALARWLLARVSREARPRFRKRKTERRKDTRNFWELQNERNSCRCYVVACAILCATLSGIGNSLGGTYRELGNSLLWPPRPHPPKKKLPWRVNCLLSKWKVTIGHCQLPPVFFLSFIFKSKIWRTLTTAKF